MVGSHSTVGDRHEMVVVGGLTRTQIAQYAGASGDFHPFHTDEAFAQANGFDSVFAHGMHTMGLTGQLVSALAGDAAIRNYTAQLRRQVWPGDTLTATAVVTAVEQAEHGTTVTVSLETRDQRREVVLTGSAELVVSSGSLRPQVD